jgi:hypothetical protein
MKENTMFEEGGRGLVVLGALGALAMLIIYCGIIYVILHFILKYW